MRLALQCAEKATNQHRVSDLELAPGISCPNSPKAVGYCFGPFSGIRSPNGTMAKSKQPQNNNAAAARDPSRKTLQEILLQASS